MNTTPATKPPSRPSGEADEKQLEQAKAEGQAYIKSLDYMVNEVADTGGKKRAGEYLVGFAQERAEGMYHLKDGELEWVAPTDENCHIEIAVVDATDHRFIPYLDIEVTVTDANGDEVTDLQATVFVAPRRLSLRPRHQSAGRRHLHFAHQHRRADLSAPRQDKRQTLRRAGRSGIRGRADKNGAGVKADWRCYRFL